MEATRTPVLQWLVDGPKTDAASWEPWRKAAMGLAWRAFGPGEGAVDDVARDEVHRCLAVVYDTHVTTPDRGSVEGQFHPGVVAVQDVLESAWENYEETRASIGAEDAPEDPQALVSLLAQQVTDHPAADHPLFDFLADKADREQLARYVWLEAPLDLRFYDVLLLAMIGAHGEARQEMAVNLHDEIGRGDEGWAHANLYRRALGYVMPGAAPPNAIEAYGWRGLAGYNHFLNVVVHRRQYFRMLGSLAVTESLDPPHYEKLLAGFRRAGFDDPAELAFYTVHTDEEMGHGQRWATRVIAPTLARSPGAAAQILTGAAIRLNTARDYFDFVLDELTSMPPTTTHPDTTAS